MNQSGESIESLMQRIQRPINCLADEDRNTRRSGLTTIKKQLSLQTLPKQHIKYLFTQTKLPFLLTKIYSDKIEANRQYGLEITNILIDRMKDDGKNIYEGLLPQMIRRISQTPFPENSQELRLMIINLYIKLVAHKDCFYKVLPQLTNSVAKCLLDPYDMLKLACCQFINKISQQLRHQVGKHANSMSRSLCANLTHQKYKVRKASLQSLSYLLIAQSAGSNFEHCRVGIKASLSDKKKQVREAALECSAKLLQYMGFKYLKQFEAVLIGYLLIGMNDEDIVIRNKVIELLDCCGAKLREQDGEMIDENSQ